MPAPGFSTPTWNIPPPPAAAPGSSYPVVLSNRTSQPMTIRISNQTTSGKTGHCVVSPLSFSVPWASVSRPGAFILGPGSERTLTVHVARQGPPGAHDLITAVTRLPSSSATGNRATATTGFQTKVTFPGKVVTVNSCVHIGPPAARHPAFAIPVIKTASTSSVSLGLVGGLAVLVLVLVVLLAVVLRRKGRHAS